MSEVTGNEVSPCKPSLFGTSKLTEDNMHEAMKELNKMLENK